MARISLTLLGPFQARRGSGHSVELPGKPAALLAYLGLRPGRAHARDVLSTLLWSESAEEHARHSLRQALTALRKRLEGTPRPLLLVDGDTVTLNPDSVDIDVVTFEGLAGNGNPGRLQQAIALYRGEFLEGCRNTEGPFGEWLVTERERLRAVAVGALTKLLAHQTDTWQDEAAIATAGRLLALEPFREAVHRTLMRVYSRRGRREDALHQYRECVAMLARELGAGPEAETRQLYHQLLEQPASMDSRRAASSNLTNTTKAALGERKQVTVLCADLKGADLGPILELMVEAVRRYEGTVTHLKPNGLTALFGVPLAHEDHAVRACRAALSMQRAVTRYSADVLRARGLGAHVRAGLNSGEVLVHSIGSDLRAEYAPVGHTTELAERLKDLAPPGAIRIAADTVRSSGGSVRATPVGQVSMKGLAIRVEVYDAISAEGVTTRFEAAARRGLSRFVGRETEIGQLGTALERARAGHGEIVAVVGEPGVGKSRLIHEFMRAPRIAGFLVLHAHTASHGRTTAYLPVIGLLRSYFRIDDRDDGRAIRAKVATSLSERIERHPDLLPATLWLLDALPEEDGFRRLEPPARRRRTLEAVKFLLLCESRAQPLVLVVEDLHWLDGETQAVLEGMVESLPTTAVLLLVSYRPEYRHGWGSKTYYRQLRIDPLPRRSAEELLHALVGDAELGQLPRLLIDTAEGNPLFLEESVRTLVETETLVGERGAYRISRPVEHLEIPTTVHAILAARIDRLPLDDKQLLQSAAVIGKDVPTSLLVAISEAPEEAVLDGLRRLQAAEFLYEARLFPDSAYTFKHALTHDVAYSSLLIDRRRALHRQIVQTIVRLYPDRLSEHVERLARHALRGELMEQAVAYGRQAGAKAMARFALREAAPHFEDALTALAHLPDTRQTLELAVDVRIQLRLAIHQLGQLERALAIAQEAERLAMKLGDDGRLGFLTCQIGMSHWLMGDKAAAHDAFERALGLATAAHDEELRLRGTYGIAVLAHDGGDYRQAATLMRTLLEELQARGSLTVRWGVGPLAVVTVVYLIWSLAEIGSFADATTLAADAIEHADAQNNPYSQTMTRLAAGIVHLRRGNIAEAIRPLERAIQLCETSGLTALGFHGIAASLGTAYMHSGRVADAIPLLERVASQARAMNVVSDHLLGAIPLAEAYLLSDRADDATRVALSSLTLARTYGQRGHEAFVHRVLGEIASRRDPASVDEAEAALGRSIELAESLGMRPLVARCHLALGQLHRRQGGPDPAREHLAIAATMFAELGMRP